MSDFEKKFGFRKITFRFILLRENDIICCFCALLKSMILFWKFLYVSDFQVKKRQRVRFLSEKKYNASDFELKKNYNATDLETNFFVLSDFQKKLQS